MPIPKWLRWNNTVRKAEEVLSELLSIQMEYRDWKDNLSESLDNSSIIEKLNIIIALDIPSAIHVVDDAKAVVDLPLDLGD